MSTRIRNQKICLMEEISRKTFIMQASGTITQYQGNGCHMFSRILLLSLHKIMFTSNWNVFVLHLPDGIRSSNASFSFHKSAYIIHITTFNFIPSDILSRKMIESKKISKISHWGANYWKKRSKIDKSQFWTFWGPGHTIDLIEGKA